MNYFENKKAAKNYALGRPDFHSTSIQKIKQILGLENKLNKALDIACGTGLSAQALLQIVENVYGTDSSQEMLNHALQVDKINYKVANAEQQPFKDNEFDLITVCSGVHWFDIDKFLIEANRLLKSESYLVLYDNFFLGEMESKSSFLNWYNQVYLNKYPSPKRNDSYDWTNESVSKFNFEILKHEEFRNEIIFTKAQLASYFITQSNIISKVESGETNYEEVENWLNNELEHFFETETQTIYFGNWINYLRKIN